MNFKNSKFVFYFALADLENELIKQQSEFDVSNEECVGHQKTIQELKSALDQVFIYFLHCTTQFREMAFSKRFYTITANTK